jgi:hypothetical protein
MSPVDSALTLPRRRPPPLAAISARLALKTAPGWPHRARAAHLLLNSIDNSIHVSRKFTLIAPAASNLAFSGRTPEISIKERAAHFLQAARSLVFGMVRVGRGKLVSSGLQENGTAAHGCARPRRRAQAILVEVVVGPGLLAYAPTLERVRRYPILQRAYNSSYNSPFK